LKTIIVIVAKDGGTQVETNGFAGSTCQQASRFIEEALGVRQSERLTAEFYAQQSSQQQVQEGRPA
jgi:hypothetical protein